MRSFNKIFCLGAGKTGTTSLHRAFLDLGLKSIHHGPPDYIDRKDHKEKARLISVQIAECKSSGENLLKYIEQYDAYSDIGMIRYNFEILDQQYPNSKFIYTDRDLEAWLDSMRRHVQRNIANVEQNLYQTKLITIDEEKWLKDKAHHLNRVKKYFAARPNDLLFIDLTKGDGYDKICPFLGIEIPSTPFPKSNIGSQEKKIWQLKRDLGNKEHEKSNQNKIENQIKEKFASLLKRGQNPNYPEIADLITAAFAKNTSRSNKKIFGYIPRIFREIQIKDIDAINKDNLYIGEPVVYKIYFPDNKELCGISYFYIFCYIKNKSTDLDVYFQSARESDRLLDQTNYDLAQTEISFEGLGSAFTGSNRSIICVSDPGHFVPGLCSSFYVGTTELNFAEIISRVLERIANTAKIKLEKSFLFGSSAGSMGALMCSSYFEKKTNVMVVNSQITVHKNRKLMEALLNLSDESEVLEKFPHRVSCHRRFRDSTNINTVPNVYILANINDSLYPRNRSFHEFYQRRFVRPNKQNQSILDSYSGTSGHARPDKQSLKAKIVAAREVLQKSIEPELSYDGVCNLCKTKQIFVKNNPSPREGYQCKNCQASLRYRGQTQGILKAFGAGKYQYLADLVKDPNFNQLSIYEPGVIGPFRKYFADFNNYFNSYFWLDVPVGEYRDSIQCQNLEELTYSNNSIDLVISSDILEHVRHPWKAFAEIWRVLKPGGYHIFSIPIEQPMKKESFYRVDTSDEEDVYLVEPRYHSAPRPQGGREESLVYVDFGRDIIERLEQIGYQVDLAVPNQQENCDIHRLVTFSTQKLASR